MHPFMIQLAWAMTDAHSLAAHNPHMLLKVYPTLAELSTVHNMETMLPGAVGGGGVIRLLVEYRLRSVT